MDESTHSMEKIRGFNFTVIGKGTAMKGDFTFEGHTSVAGSIEGVATSAENCNFVIERPGYVHGELTADSVEIYGRFEGKLVAKTKIVIHSSAEVKGDLSCHNLSIYPGALVNMQGHAEGEKNLSS